MNEFEDYVVWNRSEAKVKVCMVNGCTEISWGKGYCRPHYMAWRRHGDPLIKTREAKGHWINEHCIFIECDLPVKCKGLCRKHYQQHSRRRARDRD
jgi:hypothetical protein